jgi:kinesin family member 2/24
VIFTILDRQHKLRLLKRQVTPLRSSLFQIFARKRPLQDYEMEIGCYDACNAIQDLRTVLMHDCKLARNGRQLNMTHKTYSFDQVFNDHATNHQVCEATIAPLLRWVKGGKDATFLCFGQTGTGKTYTLSGALEYLSFALMGEEVELTFFEIYGKKCYDLFSSRRVVKLFSDEEEQVHVRGASARQSHLQTESDFLELLADALALRSSESTERNPISSRSHAICVIKLAGRGSLRLVDLAGSERNYETTEMSAAQHRESADINYTLMCLKNCFRTYHLASEANNSNLEVSSANLVPKISYRASVLTRVLRDCFVADGGHRTVIMATISPCSIDVVHSINTLDHVVFMSPKLKSLISSFTVRAPTISCSQVAPLTKLAIYM